MGLFASASKLNDDSGLSWLWNRNLGDATENLSTGAGIDAAKDAVADLDQDELLMLARTLQAEAGNQGYEGMLDVGSVIKNRAASGAYGHGIPGVIMKPGQFSAWNSKTGYAGGEQGQNMDFQPKQEAMMAAKAILTGDYEDRTGGATHYYANIPGVSGEPKWAKGKDQTKIGDHYFLQADAGRVGPTKEAARAQEAGPLGSFADRARGNTDQLNQALMARADSPMNQAVEKSEGKLGFADRGNTSPTLPGTNQPMIKGPAFNPAANAAPAATPAAAPAAVPNEVASTKSADTEEKEPTLMQKVGGWLDKERGGNKTMRDRINALGVGLGQMSHGQPVDLSSFFQGVQQQRQSVIAQKQAASEAERQYAIDAITAQTGAANAKTAQAKLAHQMAQDSQSVDYRQVAAAYPEFRVLAGLAAQGDDKAAGQLATQLGAKAAASMSGDPAVQQALQAYVAAPRDNAAARHAALTGLTPEQAEQVIDMGGDIIGTAETRPSAVKLGDEMFAADPDRYNGDRGAAYREAAKIQSGADEAGFDSELGKLRFAEATTMRKDYQTRGTVAAQSINAARIAERANDAAIENGEELSTAEEWAAGMAKELGAFGGSRAMAAFADWAGIPVESYEDLNEAKQIMMRALAQSYSGQGTISDDERAQMAREVISSDLTNKRRAEMISRIKALGAADMAEAAAFNEILPDGTARYAEEDMRIAKLRDEAVLELSTAMERYGELEYYQNPKVTSRDADEYWQSYSENPMAVLRSVTPQFTQTAARFYSESLPLIKGSDGAQYRAYRDPDGVVQLLDAPKGVTHVFGKE